MSAEGVSNLLPLLDRFFCFIFDYGLSQGSHGLINGQTGTVPQDTKVFFLIFWERMQVPSKQWSMSNDDYGSVGNVLLGK